MSGEIEFVFDLIESIFSVGKGLLTKNHNNKILRKNDTFFNFLVNLAWADKEIKPEERKFLEHCIKGVSFKKYSSKNVDECIELAKNNPITIKEIAKIFQKENKDEQKVLVKIGFIMTTVDKEYSHSEAGMMQELIKELGLTEMVVKEIIEELTTGGKKGK